MARKTTSKDQARKPGRSARHGLLTSPWADQLLIVLADRKSPVAFDELLATFSSSGAKRQQLWDCLDELAAEGLVSKLSKRRFVLQSRAPLFRGRLEQHPRGFGFVCDCQAVGKAELPEKDPFIPASRIHPACHGDQVLIRVLRSSARGRAEGTILTVLQEGPATILGTCRRQRNSLFIQPDDPGYPFTIDLPADDCARLADGDVVEVSIDRSSHQPNRVQGQLLAVIGREEQIESQFRLVCAKYQLPMGFSPGVAREAQKACHVPLAISDRLDLRTTCHVTIDGETAKDFDDAVCISRTRAGYRLHVSIADVSAYVRPGSELDKEAYLRGTSTYFPERVIPMLPEELSNDLCSLKPGVDRLTVTAILEFDKQGRLQEKKFSRSIINSQARLTYTQVKAILIDRDPELRRSHRRLLAPLKWMYDLAQALYQQRRARGAIDLDLAEPYFHIDDEGRVSGIERSSRNEAHRIIEEFMLAANEAVAATFTTQKLPLVYRIHEKPKEESSGEFVKFLNTLGIHPPPYRNAPEWYAALPALCQRPKQQFIISNLLLRSLQQARYSSANPGHFGLAATDYCHFTSPIRRYPDLMVHRALIALMESTAVPQKKGLAALEQQAEFLSGRERAAVDAERDMQQRLKVLCMRNRLGEDFSAIISGVTENQLFVEIPDLCLGGIIPVELLKDDWYLYDSAQHRLFGEMSARTYQLGDEIEVRLIEVDLRRKVLIFQPQSSPAPA